MTRSERPPIATAVRWLGRLLLHSAMLLPRALAAAALRLAGQSARAARLLGKHAGIDVRAAEFVADQASPRVLRAVLLILPLGALSLLAALLATLDEIRVLFLYRWTDAGDLSKAWGGPSMAGAWAVHALLGILLLPVFIAVMAGLARLSDLILEQYLGLLPTPGWVAPLAVVVDIAALLFLTAFVQQI